ncbi:MAG: hypothetical protein CVV42_07535 [Candidatus Riflebacteria bacterium HGW-Riflebacteria-2]|nr:MAG: hypothetical protein CVV42_07535 [Candidatus Riflebacteria bacterium HGW-Riflebacteria-2]
MKTANTAIRTFIVCFLLITIVCTDSGWCQTAKDTTDKKIASVDEVLKGTDKSSEQGTITLDAGNQGSETYTAVTDCEVEISSNLETYGNAELSVSVNDEKVISWARSHDKDPARLVVNGKEVEESNVDTGGGDYTPTTQKTKIKLKKGDKVSLNLSGDFGRANPHLSITGPGIEQNDKTPGSDNAGGAPGTTVMGSGGGFLWKPISESRGGVAVILLPSKYRHEQFNKKIWINGQTNEVLDWRPDYANGNRMHIFLKKKGAQYGGPVTIELGLAKGGRVKWEVTNGANRTER